MGKIRLEEITRENLDEVLALKMGRLKDRIKQGYERLCELHSVNE